MHSRIYSSHRSAKLCRGQPCGDQTGPPKTPEIRRLRGTGEGPIFRLSKAVEGVTETLFPPFLEVSSVLFLEFTKLLLAGCQYRGKKTRSVNAMGPPALPYSIQK